MDDLRKLKHATEIIRGMREDMENSPIFKEIKQTSLTQCLDLINTARESVGQNSTKYLDPHGALIEAIACLADAARDIQAVIIQDAAGTCTCADCEYKKSTSKSTLL
jgi:hypothetical protein